MPAVPICYCSPVCMSEWLQRFCNPKLPSTSLTRDRLANGTPAQCCPSHPALKARQCTQRASSWVSQAEPLACVYTTSAVFQFIVPSMQYLKIVAVSLCWRVPERMMASAQLKGLLTSMGNDNTCRGGQTASANDSGVCVTQCAAAMQNPTSCPCASHQAHGSEGRKAAPLQTGTLSKGSSGTRVEEGKENILQPDLWGFVVEGNNNGKLLQWCKHIAVVQTFCWQGCFI